MGFCKIPDKLKCQQSWDILEKFMNDNFASYYNTQGQSISPPSSASGGGRGKPGDSQYVGLLHGDRGTVSYGKKPASGATRSIRTFPFLAVLRYLVCKTQLI